MAVDAMLAEILRGQGKIEAKLDQLIADELESESETETESEDSGPQLATNPAIHSNMLDFDIPPIF